MADYVDLQSWIATLGLNAVLLVLGGDKLEIYAKRVISSSEPQLIAGGRGQLHPTGRRLSLIIQVTPASKAAIEILNQEELREGRGLVLSPGDHIVLKQCSDPFYAIKINNEEPGVFADVRLLETSSSDW